MPESTPPTDRILGFDLARSVAIFGMVVVHFALVMAKDNQNPPWLGALVECFDGRAAALFVVLAGMGLTLRSRSAVNGGDADSLRRVRHIILLRAFFLLLIGFANLVVWPGDILRVYGVSMLLAAWCLDASNRKLWAISLFFILGFVVLLCCFDYEKNWEWATLTYRNLWTGSGLFRNLFYDGFRSVFPWTGFLFLGMWLGRVVGADRAAAMQLVIRGLTIAVLAEGLSWGLVSHFRAHPDALDEQTIQALFGTHSMPPLPLFLFASGGAAAAVIGLSLLVAGRFSSHVLVKSLIATGQLAFTWYVAHIYLGLGALLLLGLDKSVSLPVAVATAVAFFAVAAGLSLLWRKYFRHGPLEWLMRCITG